MAGGDFLKYASENYGIDKICDDLASIETNTKIVDNPARKAATAAVREAEKALAGAERSWPGCSTDLTITPAVKNASIPALQDKINRACQAVTAAAAARKDIPAKLPASASTLRQGRAMRAGRRGLQMVLRLLAHNAEHWLSNQLNAYLRHDDNTAPSPSEHHPRPRWHHHLEPRRDRRRLRAAPRPPHRRALALLIQEIVATRRHARRQPANDLHVTPQPGI